MMHVEVHLDMRCEEEDSPPLSLHNGYKEVWQGAEVQVQSRQNVSAHLTSRECRVLAAGVACGLRRKTRKWIEWLRWNSETTFGRNLASRPKETLSLWKTIYVGSAIMATNSLTHVAEVMATRKMTFMDKWEREFTASYLKGGLVRAKNTRLRSQEV